VALRRLKQDGPVESPRAMTAATAVIDLGTSSSWSTWKIGPQTWQQEAWRLYDIVGEQRFLAGRIGDSIAQARLFVTEVDETGEETGETEDEKIRQLAAVPLGTGSARDENLRLMGVDLAVSGECWIIGEGAAAKPEEARGSWFVVTNSALKRIGGKGGKIAVRRPRHRGGSELVLQDGVDFLIRCWRSHPNDIDQADSYTRAAIVPLREIELLTKREFAELDSRLTGAGLMFVPAEADFPRDENDPPGIAGFMAYIQRAAAASMRDQSTASAMVPIIVSLPAELMQYVDQIKPITFWSDLSENIGDMKDKAILRVARSAEIPSEVLTGIGDANHWTAWLISEEGTRWIKGYLGLIADALTRGFLHPALISMGITDVEKYAFSFDTSSLAARPNRLEEALQLHDRSLLSDVEVVKAGAFSEEQMPTADELTVQRLWEVVKLDPTLIRDPAVQRALGLPEVAALPEPSPEPVEAVTDELSGQDGPPNAGAAPDVPALTASLDRRMHALSASEGRRAVMNAASKLIVFRALELAGGRLATPAERHGRWADVPRHELHFHVGAITPARAEKVTEGAWNHVPAAAADLGIRDPASYERLLSGYVSELLTRGMRHHDDLLFEALRIANRGEGLIEQEAVAA
jgi:hypothetical protein